MATTMSSWKTRRLHRSYGVDVPSMWPRRCRRGRPGMVFGAIVAIVPSMWPRRCRRGRPLLRTKLGGTWSPSMWPRRCRRGRRRDTTDKGGTELPSMWPRRCRRGRLADLFGERVVIPPFNVATTMSSWKTCRSWGPPCEPLAPSMWPRRCRRGRRNLGRRLP